MAETITQTTERISAFIKESNPNVDLGPGSVLNELIVKLSAAVLNEQRNEITELKNASSIDAVLSSQLPDVEQALLIDQIASNYFVNRVKGVKVTGNIKVTVQANRNISIPSGFRFVQPASELKYEVLRAYTVTSTVTDTQTQLELKTSGDGLFYFVIPVQAVEIGTQYQVQQNTVFAIDTGFSINGFVEAASYDNFTSGKNTETNTELIARMKEGLSAKTITTPYSVSAILKEKFPSVRQVSLIGVGDSEMLRSSNNLFGLNIPGYTDVYVRSSFGIETREVEKEVTIAPNGTSTFVLNFEDSDIAGFYDVVSVLSATNEATGSMEIVSKTFSYELPQSGRVNYINNEKDARYTIYQKLTLVFRNTQNATKVKVKVIYQPDLYDIQQLFVNSEERIPCADYLVKSIIPCFVTLNIPIVLKPGQTVFSEESKLKQDIFNYVNSIPFGESLFVSKIIDICHNYNIYRVDLPIRVDGNVTGSDNVTHSFNSSDVLEIPTSLSGGVSKNTCMYFTALQNIGITISK